MAIKTKILAIFSIIFQTKVFLPLLIVFYLFNFFFNAEPFVRSDGFCNYQIAKSIINEGSFISKTEPKYWNYMGHVKETFNGNYISVCTPGTAIAILPGLSIANLFNGTDNINNNFFLAYNGHTLAEGISIVLTAIIFSVLAWILIFKSLRLLGFSERNSWFSILAVFLSSYALWYVFILPSYTHTYEIFAVALLLYSFIKIQKQAKLNKNKNWKIFLVCGLALGFAVIVRPTLFPIVLLVSFAFLLQKKSFKQILSFILGGLPFLIIFLLYNFISYGDSLSFGYSTVRGENFSFSNFYILEILFSPLKGWFVFSPIYLLSIAGLILLFRKNRSLSIISIVGIFSIALLYSAWSQWWGGGSYGSRFMCFAVPFGAIGLANLLSYSKRLKITFRQLIILFIVVFTLFSTGVLFLYRVVDINGSWFYTPIFLYKTEVSILKEVKSIPDIFQVHYDHVYEGSSLWKLYNKDFVYALTILENTDNSTIEFRLFTSPYGTTLPLPKNIKYYLVDNLNGNIYESSWQSNKQISTLNLKSMELKIIKDLKTLPIGDYYGINFFSIGYKMFIQKNINVAVRGNLIILPRGDTQYKL